VLPQAEAMGRPLSRPAHHYGQKQLVYDMTVNIIIIQWME
jgi:hypothetical protein